MGKNIFFEPKEPFLLSEIFSELKQEGLTAQEALSLLCNLENKPTMSELNKGGKKLLFPENSNSWATNVLSWTNENVQISLRGLTIYYDDLYNKTEDKLIEIAAHLKESGLEVEINPLEISKIAEKFRLNEKNKTLIELSNKEKKIIDRDCGDIIEKYFSERTSN